MEWQETALAIATRRHGEADTILEVITRDRGRHLGLVKGGRSRRMRPLLQPGNTLHVTWRARLSEHLGRFNVEAVVERVSDLMASRTAIYGIQLLGAHFRLLPERDPHPRLFDAGQVIVENLNQPSNCAELMIRFEILLLEELGFGLDLGRCAVSDRTDGLTHVSPKTGRAVTAEVAEPYADRLFRLPIFLIDRKPHDPPGLEALGDGFDLTGSFLDRHVYAPRNQPAPDVRRGFIRAVLAEGQTERGASINPDIEGGL